MTARMTELRPQEPAAVPVAMANRPQRRPRRYSQARSMFAHGEPLVWLTGGALVLAMAMILALLALVITLGLATFWPGPLVEVKLRDGRVLLGEVFRQDHFQLNADTLLAEPSEVQQSVVEQLVQDAGDLSGLARQLGRKLDRLQAESDDVQARLEQAQAKVARLDRGRVQPEGPFDRSEMIRRDSLAERVQKARGKLAALKQRAAALTSERQSAEQAGDYYQQLPHVDAAAILQAEPRLRLAGVDALISLAQQADENSTRVRRRMLRTGNFELTNEHFNWVADYQILPEGESRPGRATLVERTAWGRFYGQPRALTVKHSRQISSDETELATLVDFWQQHEARLPADPAEPSQRGQLLQQLQQDYATQRTKATESFAVDLTRRLRTGQHLVLQTAAGTQLSADQLTAGDDVLVGLVQVDDAELAWQEFQNVHPTVLSWLRQIERLEKHDLGILYASQEAARLRVRQAELDYGVSLQSVAAALIQAESTLSQLRGQADLADAVVAAARRRYGDTSEIAAVIQQLRDAFRVELQQQQVSQQSLINSLQESLAAHPAGNQTVQQYLQIERSTADASQRIQKEIQLLKEKAAQYELHLVTSDGKHKSLSAGDVVRAFQPNRLSRLGAWSVYFSRWREFLSSDPREANSEGGVLPAIWGTIVMTLIMSMAVVPFGVIASLYLREYAKSGTIVSVIRVAINNLAGVPSIVFGVFGLGFFCYIIGAFLDGGPRNAGIEPLPPTRWFVIFCALAASALVAFALAMISLRRRSATRSIGQCLCGYASVVAWLLATSLLVIALFKSPFFGGFYESNLPSPYWGKGGVLWAALTLALMTLPVVIVATEEALSAVPNSMREGSYGCGASKWQTIRRIVLPHALPGIMTGMILAMARGAGEVAPLMLVGAVKLAPELPIDASFPFVHGNRSFMHLGFHIFDVGFQSQNSEAAKPMVYTTTLLLIVIISVLNLLAVRLRGYLRKRFASAEF
jgi:ABC-type phosphate transport system permease subunit/ABC-type phosphate transport system auxiliary subunit